MKSLTLVILALGVVLLGGGCQRARLATAEMPQQFFASWRNASPGEDAALRSAQYYHLVGRSDLALSELQRALTLSPDNVRLLNAVAGCYDKLGNYAKAQEIYEKALTLETNNHLIRNNLGFSCYLAGDWSRAEKIFQEILVAQPHNTLARNNLGLLWCRLGREKEALHLWQQTDGELQAREKLQQVLAYLGKPVAKTGLGPPARVAKTDDLPEPAPYARLKPAATQKPVAAAAQSYPKPAALQPAPGAAAEPAAVPDKTSPRKSAPSAGEPRVKVEEVKMIVQPASLGPPPVALQSPSPADTLYVEPARARPPAPDEKCRPAVVTSPPEDDILAEAEEPRRPRQAWHRFPGARTKKPKIIIYDAADSPKPHDPLKSLLQQETSYHPVNRALRQESAVY